MASTITTIDGIIIHYMGSQNALKFMHGHPNIHYIRVRNKHCTLQVAGKAYSHPKKKRTAKTNNETGKVSSMCSIIEQVPYARYMLKTGTVFLEKLSSLPLLLALFCLIFCRSFKLFSDSCQSITGHTVSDLEEWERRDRESQGKRFGEEMSVPCAFSTEGPSKRRQ